MQRREESPREVALPASALAAIRRSLRSEAGPLATIHALHAAGYDAGEVVHASFARVLGTPPEETSERRFWSCLEEFLARRGWGTLVHHAAHPGLGVLSSPDWAEAGQATESQPACAFTTGLLSHLLTRAAGGPVAVLEVSCRARGDDRCTFAFGSEATVHDLYGLLLDGADLDTAMRGL